MLAYSCFLCRNKDKDFVPIKKLTTVKDFIRNTEFSGVGLGSSFLGKRIKLFYDKESGLAFCARSYKNFINFEFMLHNENLESKHKIQLFNKLKFKKYEDKQYTIEAINKEFRNLEVIGFLKEDYDITGESYRYFRL